MSAGRPAFREVRPRPARPNIRVMDRYEIRVAGHLDRRRAQALGCEEVRLLPGRDSLLVFAGLDQAALYGLLARLRDAGLELVAAERVPASTASADGGAPATGPAKEHSHVTDRSSDDH